MDEVRRSLVLQCCTLLCCKIGSFGKARQNLSYPELFGAISRLGWAEVCGVKNRENRWMVWTCWTLGASGVPWPWSKTLPTLMRPISVGHKREHSRWIMILGGHRSTGAYKNGWTWLLLVQFMWVTVKQPTSATGPELCAPMRCSPVINWFITFSNLAFFQSWNTINSSYCGYKLQKWTNLPISGTPHCRPV